MAKNETKRLTATVVDEDDKAVTTMKALTGYAPSNPAYTVAELSAADAELKDAKEAATLAANALKAASDVVTAAQWKRHNIVLGCRQQVVAQYGDDSNEAQSVGRKKKSEYKSPTRKPKP